MARIILILFYLFTYIESSGQNTLIKGRVLDDSTGEPIPFVNITIRGTEKGTSTNIQGEFIVSIPELPAHIIFSHISYNKKIVEISNHEDLSVRLNPGTIILNEVIVNEDQNDNSVYELIKKAYNRITRLGDVHYGQAIYRQHTENDSVINEYFEIFYDVQYSREGIQNWEIQQGRYAIKNNGKGEHFVVNKNFTLLTRLFPFYQPPTERLIVPMNPIVDDFYRVNIKELRTFEGKEIAVIHCKPKRRLSTPAFEGELWISLDNYDLLKVRGKIEDDYFRVVELNGRLDDWKNYVIELEAAFKPQDDNLLLDYITIRQSFDYYLQNRFKNHVTTHSFFSVYDHYPVRNDKKLGGPIRFKQSDKDRIDKAGYDPEFWKNNPVVARTPLEKGLISFFESENAFKRAYLNERSMVRLDTDTLETDPLVRKLSAGLDTMDIGDSEKLYLHLDKPHYISGEAIRFNAFLVDLGNLTLSDSSRILYVDLLSPAGEILSIKQFSLADGISKGTIGIPDKAASGRYRIRAYTHWMKKATPDFIFDRELNIYHMNDISGGDLISFDRTTKFSVQFFPEGGNLIYKVPSRVAFKATDATGKGIQLQGIIVDDSARKVTDFSTRHNGMGSFSLLPDPGRKYFAVTEFEGDQEVFSLPFPVREGIVFSVNNLKQRDIDVLLKPSERFYDTEVYLIGQARGKLYHKQKILIKKGGTLLTLPRDKFPAGICQLTVFSNEGVPISERLIFIMKKSEINTSVHFDKKRYLPHEFIDLKIDFSDSYNRMLEEAVVSVSVTNADIVKKGPDSESVESYLLLSSDIRGPVEDPGYYFKDESRETAMALDLVMLTNGWRRFLWHNIGEDSIRRDNISREKDLMISGVAYLEDKDEPFSNGIITFLSLDQQYPGVLTVKTDKYGRFQLEKVHIPDTIPFLTKSMNEKGKLVNTDIMFREIEPLPAMQNNSQKYPVQPTPDILRHQNAVKELGMIDSMYNFEDAWLMDEVTIKAERYYGTKYGKPDLMIEMDDNKKNYTNILQYLKATVPGLSITGSGINSQLLFRGISSLTVNSTPLFILDGLPLNNPIPISAFSSSSLGTLTDQINNNIPINHGDNSSLNAILLSIDPSEVEKIEVLKSYGTATSAFGYQGSNGVIIITTKLGAGEIIKRRTRGYEPIRLPAFSVSKELYQPDYSTTSDENTRPDKRITLLFDVFRISNNLNGALNVGFYNSDVARSFQVIIEGITSSGIPFTTDFTFEPESYQ